jgi:hypothetical protein
MYCTLPCLKHLSARVVINSQVHDVTIFPVQEIHHEAGQQYGLKTCAQSQTLNINKACATGIAEAWHAIP